ncbi:MAG: lysine--tRNA ligase [Alphaproteobacteria bacterium]|nr:lysine--tRNA ligase [Alphaproteobacteria bacterium]
MNTTSSSTIAEMARNAKAWPFKEAKQILARLESQDRPASQPVLFQTGYGPSGLPHIGTFSEVMRTSMVRHAFSMMSDLPTRLIVFSDDMDGLRRVPDNVPNQALLAQYLNCPLTKVPDPFGEQPSFGQYNNAMLKRFLDSFGFEYKFLSSSEVYRSGRFDQALLRLLNRYDAVMNIMLPTLREKRRATYSPFLPICPESGHVLQVPVIATDAGAGTITYRRTDGVEVTTLVTGGHCKLQWKPDWAMRWYAYSIDYEMSGKDLIDSVKASRKIVSVLGGTPPLGLSYEHFLDQDGQKISKSKGNGLTIDEWLQFGPPKSLSLFMFQKPKTAKRLCFDVIPKTTDEYAQHLKKAHALGMPELLENPAYMIHESQPPQISESPSFSMILNLVAASDSASKDQLWGFLQRYDSSLDQDDDWINRLLDHAIAYYKAFIQPNKVYAEPDDATRSALLELAETLKIIAADTPAQDLQQVMFDIGKAHGFDPVRAWFSAFYQVLLGQSEGPRAGSFIALYGIADTIKLIEQRLA